MYQPPYNAPNQPVQPQTKHSLPSITIQHPKSAKTITWKHSQPVKIWSQSATKWCPGEISYITEDADGYCLDVRYWATPQLPKAKYLAPDSSCLRAINQHYECRNEWGNGSKVECFSNSQKRWYKATVVEVIRYQDDKEDWLKIQWSLDTSSQQSRGGGDTTPSNQPQIMSKEVGRSSIWIRHRYPSFKNQSPPNTDDNAHSGGHAPPPPTEMNYSGGQRSNKGKSRKTKKSKKDSKSKPMSSKSPRSDRPAATKSKDRRSKKRGPNMQLHDERTVRHDATRSNDRHHHNTHRTNSGGGSGMMGVEEQRDLVTAIVSPLQTRGPPSKEMSDSFTAPESYQQSQHIRHFMANGVQRGVNQSRGPLSSAMSRVESVSSSAAGKLTPQMSAMQTPRSPEHLDLLKDVESTENDDSGDADDRKSDHDRKLREHEVQSDDCLTASTPGNDRVAVSLNKSPEFGAAFKPDDYKETKMDDLDDELMKEFEDIDSSEEDGDGDTDYGSESESRSGASRLDPMDGDDRGRTVTPNAEEMDIGMMRSHRNGHHLGDASDDDAGDSDKEKPILVQSESAMAHSSNGHSWDEERKEMMKDIEDLKFKLVLAQQDLQNEQETSEPLLKEVEMQKIRIAKLEEENRRLSQSANLSPVHSPSQSPHHEAVANPNATVNTTNISGDIERAVSDPVDSVLSKREEFQKLLESGRGRKRHVRSVSFTSSTFSSLDRGAAGGTINGSNRGSGSDDSLGLRSQELIDVWKCRKVELLSEQIDRLKAEMKKKESKMLEYKTSATNRKHEVCLLEKKLSEYASYGNNKQVESKKQRDSDNINISQYRHEVRKLTQTNEQLLKKLQTADDKLKSAELKRQDLQDEFNSLRQKESLMQNKVQRVLQQHHTISGQVEKLQTMLMELGPYLNLNASPSPSNGHQHRMNGMASSPGTAAHNHLDTIRKCNSRGIQLLLEIAEKRKRSSLHSGFAASANINAASNVSPRPHDRYHHSHSHSNSNAKRSRNHSHRMSDRPPSMGDRDHIGNTSRTLMHYGYDDEDDEEHQSRHHTKSTRFSDLTQGRGRGRREKTTSRGFEFGDGAVGRDHHSSSDQMHHDHPQSTRSSRGWQPPSSSHHRHMHTASGSSSATHRQLSQSSQLMANMQPLVLKDGATNNSNHSHSNHNHNQRLLSVDENNLGFRGSPNQNHNHHHQHSNGSRSNSSSYSVREKRVSYDYVDGNNSDSVHRKYPQRRSANNSFYRDEAFDEQEEDEYVEEFRARQSDRGQTTRHRHYNEAMNGDGEAHQQQMSHRQHHHQHHHNEDSLQQLGVDEDVDDQNLTAFMSKWWTVKFPRRSSKVGLFGANKGHKTQIVLDNEAGDVVLRCDASNNHLVSKIGVADIHNIELSEKKNVSMFTTNGRKYKIKCDAEQDAKTWYNLLNQFVHSTQ